MENKDLYFKAFIQNNGKLNEIELGDNIGINERETREIIAQLLSEHKIDYLEHKACSYSLMRTTKRKKNSR